MGPMAFHNVIWGGLCPGCTSVGPRAKVPLLEIGKSRSKLRSHRRHFLAGVAKSACQGQHDSMLFLLRFWSQCNYIRVLDDIAIGLW
jgi:hypothetical protein